MAEFRSYADAYNFLLGKFQERGFLKDVSPKNPNASVSTGDMDTLRNALGDMAYRAADLSQLEASLPLEKFPTVGDLGGKNFISLPGAFNSAHTTYFADVISFSLLGVVLPQHFTDIVNHLNKLCNLVHEAFMPVKYPAQSWSTVSRDNFYGSTVTPVSNPSYNSIYSSCRCNADMRDAGYYSTIRGTFTQPTDRPGVPHTCYYIDKYTEINDMTGNNVITRQWKTWSGATTDIVGERLTSGHPLITKDRKILCAYTVFTYPKVEAISFRWKPCEKCQSRQAGIGSTVDEGNVTTTVALGQSGGSSGKLVMPLTYSFMNTAAAGNGLFNLDSKFTDVKTGSKVVDGATVYWKFSKLTELSEGGMLYYWDYSGTAPKAAHPVIPPDRKEESPTASKESDGSTVIRTGNSGLQYTSSGTLSGMSQTSQDTTLSQTIAASGVTVVRDGNGFPFDFTSATGRTKLTYTPPTSTTPAIIARVDYYKPGESTAYKYITLTYDTSVSGKRLPAWEIYENGVLSAKESYTYDADGNIVHTIYDPVSPASAYKTVTYGKATIVGGVSSITETTVCNGTTYSVMRQYETFGFGSAMTAEILAAGSADELVTKYGYYDTNDGSSGKLRFVLRYDATWEYYTYDSIGRLTVVYQPFFNAALAFDTDGNVIAPAESDCAKTTYDYAILDAAEDVREEDDRPRTITTYAKNTIVGRTFQLFFANEYRSIVATTATQSYNTAGVVTTKKFSYPSGIWAGQHWKTENPDGTMEFTEYAAITGGRTVTTSNGAPNAAKTAIADGVKIVSTRNANDYETQRTEVDIASNLTVSTESYLRDFKGRITQTTYPDGSKSSTIYACCGPKETTGRDGMVTTYTYTPDQRNHSTTAAGVTQENTYHANGNTLTQMVVAADGTRHGSVMEYYTNGLLYRTKVLLSDLADGAALPTADSAYAITRYLYDFAYNYYRTLAYQPTGGYLGQYLPKSGKLYGSFGSAAVATVYTEPIVSGGKLCNRKRLAHGGGIDETTITYYNFSGTVWKTTYPDGTFDLTEYDAALRPVKNTAANGVITLTVYNSRGEVWKRGIDMVGNGVLGADDPITEYLNSVANKTVSGTTLVVRKQEVKQYAESGAVTVQTTETSASGRTWQTEFGRTTATVTTYYNDASEKGASVATTHPDGSTLNESYSDGLLENSTESVLGETAYTYDKFNRVATASHTEGGKNHVVSYEYNSRNLQTKVTESCSGSTRSTTYTYDNAGRKLTETKPGSRTVTYTYFTTGELKTMTGAETYPQGYTYEFGRLKTLTTYRNYSADPEVTTWIYNNAGQLTAKKYANNSQVAYEYDSFGQLSKRTWAGGRTTDYAYDGAGRLATVTYSGNDTPAIAYSYDRRGHLTQVIDAAGTRTITYNADNTPATETVPNVTGHTVTHIYDTLGRETTLKLMNGATVIYETGYTYDNMSRLATATFANQSATYSRVSGSNRLNTTVFKNGTTAVHTATRSYDNFNRLLGVNGYNYTYNDKDERTKQTLADGNYWDYGYDTLGQVTSGAKKTSAGGQVSGQNYGYTYDTIGNRKTATANSAVTNYTANDVNHYTAIGSVAPTYDPDGNMLTGYQTAENALAEMLLHSSLPQDAAESSPIGGLSVPVSSPLDSAESLQNILSATASPAVSWTMEWNGENRLKTIYTATTKLEFQYDYMGRRFSKKVYTKSGSSWVLSNEKAFAYNGYKQIAEYTVSGTTKTLSKSTVWQPAASGDLDVVLWYRDGNIVYTLLPDGNKNTRQLKTTAGTVAATYDYDPFGNIIATTGTVTNPWKFSSEYHDSETGWVYYNYRDYAPSLGRWISRDPIGEKGGVNLFSMCNNDCIYKKDHWGLDDLDLAISIPLEILAKIPEIILGTFGAGLATSEATIGGRNPIAPLQALLGVPFSLLSGDPFFSREDDAFSKSSGGCDFLITINGIFNNKNDADALLKAVVSLNKYKEASENSIAAKNPTTYIGDFIQILGDELGTIGYTSNGVASIIRKAAEQAQKNGCGDCYKIHVVAHSQGTSVFYRALPLINADIRAKIHFVGMGGQRFADNSLGLASYANYANWDDAVPLIGNYNPFRLFGIPRNIIGANTQWNTFGGDWWSWGTRHPWDQYYIKQIK